MKIMTKSLIGRKEEIATIDQLRRSQEAEFLCVYGRRRVGKTFLIRSYFENDSYIYFELTGVRKGTTSLQLKNFASQLSKTFYDGLELATPSSWSEALERLSRALEKLKSDRRKKVIFFDELPWLASRRSGFIPALEYFWNSWCVKQKDLILVVCGSAASWMISNIIDNKGGLHNRVTSKIKLAPFSVLETVEYLRSRGNRLSPKQIIELYLCFGGVPHYLRHIKPKNSVPKIIDQLCFSPRGLLRDEFDNLYAALYENSESYINIVKALSKKRKGLDRKSVASRCKISPSGQLTEYLRALSESEFIQEYAPFGKRSRDLVYRLVDEYSLFYLNWLEKLSRKARDLSWQHLYNSNPWRIWAGFSFENLCHKHVNQIKNSLGIAGVYSEESVWSYKGGHREGAQIDLLIDRADNIINLCEIKFNGTPFLIDKRYAAELERKRSVFIERTKTKKPVFTTLITASGVKENDHYHRVVSDQVVVSEWIES